MGISFNAASLLSGNGIDVNSIVNEVLNQKNGQLSVWQQQQTELQSQAADLSTINGALTSLVSSVNSLTDVLGPLNAKVVSSSDSSIIGGTAQISATAGNHQIIVDSLATVGTVFTDSVADPNASILPGGATSGDLQLEIGGAGGETHAIAITQGSNDTLNTLASYINVQNWGVTASVVTDANGSRLAISSQSSGSAGALAIVNNTTSLNFEAPIGGTNASLSVDGIPFSSASNTVTGAIPGVTLNLITASPGNPVQLTVGADTTQASSAINNFVSSYNSLIGFLNQEYTVDPTTNAEGDLASDSSLRSLQSSLLTDATYSVSGNDGDVNLAALGINMNDDGTLTVDSSTLGNALTNDPGAVLNFFQNSSLTGFANNFNADLTNLSDPTTGVLSTDLAQNSAEQKNLTDQINNFQDRLNAEQQQLITQFSQVNATLEEYPFLLQEVTSQLGQQTSSSNSNNSGGAAATGTPFSNDSSAPSGI
ncbi:MAG TPA: flagellar filament capping protein FliD [Terriglobales bacterium]|jgi:flagellar hook-associated protein 2